MPRFTKFHGFGNDYLVFEADQLANVADLGRFAHRICNRHYGAGGDGIAVVARSSDANSDFTVRIFNPDGSEAGMSGNGTRCAAAYLHYHKLWTCRRTASANAEWHQALLSARTFRRSVYLSIGTRAAEIRFSFDSHDDGRTVGEGD